MESKDLIRRIRPPTGKVVVLLDHWEQTRLINGVWLVDSTPAMLRYRMGTVIAVSALGMQILGGYTVPHTVKRGDRVMVDRSAAKILPGGAMRSGTLNAVWENYIMAIVEGEPDRDRRLLDAGLDDLVEDKTLLKRPVCVVCNHSEPVAEIMYADTDIEKETPFHVSCWKADMAVRQAGATALMEATSKVRRPDQDEDDE